MTRLLLAESHVGRSYQTNNDRIIADDAVPLFAAIDSECDDGAAGDAVVSALLEAAPALSSRAVSVPHTYQTLRAALYRAHQGLVDRRQPGGASVTAATRAGSSIVILHVGDGRLYVREATGWFRKTCDHTLLEQALAAGDPQLVDEVRRLHSSVVTRVIGLTSTFHADTVVLPIGGGLDVFLCTRGAWMPLDPEGRAEPLPAHLDAKDVGKFVLDRYREDGERDNASLIVARFDRGSGA
jgi:serine/threonine protein phosphatase PrpC